MRCSTLNNLLREFLGAFPQELFTYQKANGDSRSFVIDRQMTNKLDLSSNMTGIGVAVVFAPKFFP